MSYVVGIWRYILCSVASIYSILSGRCNVWMYSYDRLRLELLQPPHSDSIITYPSPNIEDCSIYFSYPVYRAILLIKKKITQHDPSSLLLSLPKPSTPLQDNLSKCRLWAIQPQQLQIRPIRTLILPQSSERDRPAHHLRDRQNPLST